MNSSEASAAVELLRAVQEDGALFSVAAALGELLEAEEAGLVEAEAWRRSVDVAELESFVAAGRDDVAAEWEQELAVLRKWFGFQLIYEETLMFLMRRSELESATLFLDESYRARLAQYDEEFAATLHENEQSMASARRAPGLALTHRLPAHWWWRTSTPTARTPP